MALKALDIYKLLPKKNCKECGDPTCLTFAMKLAAGKGDVSLCPYLDESAKNVLGASTRPPLRLVKIGVGERAHPAGEEFGLFRHEKTFYHPPGIFYRVRDTLPETGIAEVVRQVKTGKLTRVGIDLMVNGIAVTNESGSPDAFARAVAVVEENADLPLVLSSRNTPALAAALVHCGTYRPLIYAADSTNYREYSSLAKQHGCPLAVTAAGIDELASLAAACVKEGADDLVLDPAPASLGGYVASATGIRQLAITRTAPALGNPL